MTVVSFPGGMQARVITEEEAEGCLFVVCSTADMPTRFSNNVETSCGDCGVGIYHRPTVPVRPPKLCPRCSADRIDAGPMQ